MTVNPADSAVFGDLWCTQAMRAIFCDVHRFQRMADVEAALARVQAGLGIIPRHAADAISGVAADLDIDIGRLRDDAVRIGYPVTPLIRQMAALAGEEAGRFVHWGATTQDIMDTGLVLQMRDGLGLLEADLDALVDALAGLADTHRGTVMAGRTHMQHALPITFGFKCATWLAPLLRIEARLKGLPQDALWLQFSGAVGTLASLGRQGEAVARGLAEELGLPRTPVTWHAGRDGLASIAGALAELCGTLGKIATDIALLMQTEIAELAEPPAPGRGGSSTMPQKRNPVLCEYVIAAARNVHQAVPVVYGAMLADHERATGPWHAEWVAVPQIFALTSGALANTLQVVRGLEVDAARMRANLDMTGGLVLAEAVMMALAPHLGRDRAHDAVEALCRAAASGELSFAELLSRDSDVATHLEPAEIARLLDPLNYTGLAESAVDSVLADVQERR
jgi:3-carboxy-cis,cis-muconate cycloisomerase